MTDPTSDHDDHLRAALRAEADGVDASPELLDRIRAAAPVPRRWRARAGWLTAAAVAIVAVGVAGALLARDDADQQVDAVDDPAPPPAGDDLRARLSTLLACETDDGMQLVVYLAPGSTDGDITRVWTALDRDERTLSVRVVEPMEVERALAEDGEAPAPAGPDVPHAVLATFATNDDELAVRSTVADLPGVYVLSTSDCRDPGLPPDTGRPTVVALVREDGMLVVVDLATGAETELHSVGDPRASSDGEEGGPYFIDGVELSADGRTVYFSTCCEPASGYTYRIPVTGGEPELFAVGAYPRLSPDGRWLATADADHLIVTSVTGMARVGSVQQIGYYIRSLAWSPDGKSLASTNGAGDVPDAQVLLYTWDGEQLSAKDQGKPDNPGDFVSWTPDGTLNVLAGGPLERARYVSQDRSYRWLLWVDETGQVREGEDRTPIARLPNAITADW